MHENGDQHFVGLIKDAYENAAKAGVLQFKNYLYLERGPYNIVSVMDEGVTSEPFSVKGTLIDLYDPKLPVLSEKIVQPGTQALMYNIDRVNIKKQPQVLAAASRVYDEKTDGNNYSFIAKSPVNTTNSMRILLPQNPKEISVKNEDNKALPGFETSWDNLSKTLYLSFENNPNGVNVIINW